MNQQNQQYHQPPQPTGPAGPSSQGQTMAVVSLVCGIVSIVLPIPFLDLAIAIVGLVCAGKAKQYGYNGGIRTAGLVLSIIGTIFSALITLSFLACMPFLPFLWLF